jgi:hypothetical protein
MENQNLSTHFSHTMVRGELEMEKEATELLLENAK